jgi:oxygen-independent coproporphyrinogen-3 oxidase
VQHLSTYLLQIEPGTPFAESKIVSACPDEDTAAAMYLQTASQLEAAGYRQYEISNFALPGFESRHNNKYWNCEEYLGFGPSAHSYWQGERFCYPADLQGFLQHPTLSDRTPGGDATEYAMLRLRLMDGLYFADFARRGGDPDLLRKRLAKYKDTDLVTIESERFFLTAKGCLVSNTIICDLLFES